MIPPRLSDEYRQLVWPCEPVLQLHGLHPVIRSNSGVLHIKLRALIANPSSAASTLSKLGFELDQVPLFRRGRCNAAILHFAASLSRLLSRHVSFETYLAQVGIDRASWDREPISQELYHAMNSLWPAASADCCSVENWSKFLVLTALLEQRISQQVRYIQQRLVSSADSDDDEGRDAAYSSMMSAILDPSSQFSSYHASTCFWLRCLFNGRHGINLRNLVWHGFVLPGDLHPQWIALLITITCEFEHVVQSQFKVASHNLDAECAATPAIMKQRAVQICSIYHGVANTNTNDLGNEFVRIVEAEHDLCNQERQFCRIGQSMRESFLSIYNDGSSSSSSVGACFAEPQTAAVAEDLHQMLTETLRQLAGVQEQPAQTSRTFQNVKLISFGRQKSSRPPYDMDKIFNCEKLKNPSSSSRKGRTGLDKRLRKEIMSDARARQIVEEAVSYIVRRLDSWDGSGKANLFIGLRCAMGKHRSVTIAEEISSQLRVRQKQTCGPRAQAAVSVQHWALEHPPQPKGRERNLKGSRKRHANVPNVAVRPHEQSNDVTQAEPLDWSDTEEVNLVNFCFQCYSKGKFATFLRVSTVLLEIWLRRLFCRLNSAVVDQSLMTAEVGRYFATLDGYGQRHLHQVVILQSIHSSALSPKLRQTDKQFPNELLTWLTNAQRNLLYDLYLVQAGPALRAKLAHGWVLNRDFMATSCGDPPCPVATFTLAMLASIVENASRSQPNPLFGDHSRIRSLFQVIPQRISSVFLKASPATLFQRLFFHQSERFCRQLRLALQCLHSTLDAFIPMLPRTETDDDRRHNGFELDSKDMCFILEKALCLLEHPDSNSTRNCNIPNEEMTRPTMRVIVRAKVASRLKFVVRDVIVALQDCCSRISGSQPNQQARAPPRMVSLPEAIDVELWACARKLGMDRTSVERGPQTEVEHPAISGGAIALLGDCRRLLEHMLNHYRVLAHRAVTRTARTGHRNMLVKVAQGACAVAGAVGFHLRLCARIANFLGLVQSKHGDGDDSGDVDKFTQLVQIHGKALTALCRDVTGATFDGVSDVPEQVHTKRKSIEESLNNYLTCIRSKKFQRLIQVGHH